MILTLILPRGCQATCFPLGR